MVKEVHVAVGVITAADGKICIARRADSAHQGGLWEFPGGKVASGETVQQALARELEEELAIQVVDSEPLIKIRHDYGDKQVLLDVHRVTGFTGEPIGNEGQPVQWVSRSQLANFDFPKANRAIVTALQLPDKMLITGGAQTESLFLERVEHALKAGIRLVQLRVNDGSQSLPNSLVSNVQASCREHGAELLLNTSPEVFSKTSADGLHLNRHQLMQLSSRPIGESQLLGASCHNVEEILQAKKIEVDYILLSPVAKTASHPDANPLGWDKFAALVELAGCPVFALGGMQPDDLPVAKQHGAQGIAAISAWWKP
jgi:8-oxo-dGTP diphosphatase